MAPTARQIHSVTLARYVDQPGEEDGMMNGMTKSKIAISLDADLVTAVKALVSSGHADSVSAFVSDALEDKLNVDNASAFYERVLTESGGPMTEAERAWADQVLE